MGEINSTTSVPIISESELDDVLHSGDIRTLVTKYNVNVVADSLLSMLEHRTDSVIVSILLTMDITSQHYIKILSLHDRIDVQAVLNKLKTASYACDVLLTCLKTTVETENDCIFINNVAEIAGEAKCVSAIPSLERLLTTGNRYNYFFNKAALALGKIGTNQVIPALVSVMDQGRLDVVKALCMVASPAVIEPLSNIICNDALTWMSTDAYRDVVVRLASFTDDKVVPPLLYAIEKSAKNTTMWSSFGVLALEALDNLDVSPDQCSNVLWAVADAGLDSKILAKVIVKLRICRQRGVSSRDDSFKMVLTKLLDSSTSSTSAINIAKALGDAKERLACQPLQSLLERCIASSNYTMLAHACDALGNIQDRSVLPALLAAMIRVQPESNLCVVTAIRKIGMNNIIKPEQWACLLFNIVTFDEASSKLIELGHTDMLIDQIKHHFQQNRSSFAIDMFERLASRHDLLSCVLGILEDYLKMYEGVQALIVTRIRDSIDRILKNRHVIMQTLKKTAKQFVREGDQQRACKKYLEAENCYRMAQDKFNEAIAVKHSSRIAPAGLQLIEKKLAIVYSAVTKERDKTALLSLLSGSEQLQCSALAALANIPNLALVDTLNERYVNAEGKIAEAVAAAVEKIRKYADKESIQHTDVIDTPTATQRCLVVSPPADALRSSSSCLLAELVHESVGQEAVSNILKLHAKAVGQSDKNASDRYLRILSTVVRKEILARDCSDVNLIPATVMSSIKALLSNNTKLAPDVCEVISIVMIDETERVFMSFYAPVTVDGKIAGLKSLLKQLSNTVAADTTLPACLVTAVHDSTSRRSKDAMAELDHAKTLPPLTCLLDVPLDELALLSDSDNSDDD